VAKLIPVPPGGTPLTQWYNSAKATAAEKSLIEATSMSIGRKGKGFTYDDVLVELGKDKVGARFLIRNSLWEALDVIHYVLAHSVTVTGHRMFEPDGKGRERLWWIRSLMPVDKKVETRITLDRMAVGVLAHRDELHTEIGVEAAKVGKDADTIVTEKLASGF
jgi:hypothetical protein